jgi:hypothetical protein
VRTPFTLEPQAHDMKTPVPTNQPHHSGVNALHDSQRWPWKVVRRLNIQIPQFTEANVGIHSEREEKDQGGVQQNEA